ncbi:hypothetical protein [Caudoviricetes sp.]|nr:hypothetical protein [Caudoviricetes sp.]
MIPSTPYATANAESPHSSKTSLNFPKNNSEFDKSAITNHTYPSNFSSRNF